MVHILLSIFVLLHGVVHLLYFGQSMRFFKLQSELTWPDGSWILDKLAKDRTIRNLGGILMIVSSALFFVGSFALFFNHYWHRPVLFVASVFSSLIYTILWDGKYQKLPDKGFIGVLINLAIIAGVFIFD